MKKILVPLLVLLLPLPVSATSEQMESLLARGASAYEHHEYAEALEHFSAALLHAAVTGENPLYAATYLCAYWYKDHGHGATELRARNACTIARGDMERFQLELFRQVLQREGDDNGLQIDRDAAEALEWFLDLDARESPHEEFPEP